MWVEIYNQIDSFVVENCKIWLVQILIKVDA